MGIGNREEQKQQQHELPKSRKCIRKRFENYNNKEKLDNKANTRRATFD
jgi:hypothetical protein